MTGGLPPRSSDTHCGVIAITKSYHLPHHSGTISANVVLLWNHIKCKKKNGIFLKNLLFRGKGRRVSMSISLLWQKLSHLMQEPNRWIQLSFPVPNPQETVPKDAHFSSSLTKSQKKSHSLEQCTFSYLKKERKSISGFNMRGWESILPGFRFFSLLSWAVNRNNGIWLLQGQGCFSW